MKKSPLLLSLVVLLSFALPAYAQQDAAPAAAASAAAAPDLEQRLALARKMHDIKPMTVQIEDAIRALSMRYPEDKRELFVLTMTQTFDQKALSEISVKAMAETFTAAELEKMIDFHGSAEGKAISEKMPVYQSIVEPELIKKIDQALMEVRLGKTPGK